VFCLRRDFHQEDIRVLIAIALGVDEPVAVGRPSGHRISARKVVAEFCGRPTLDSRDEQPVIAHPRQASRVGREPRDHLERRVRRQLPAGAGVTIVHPDFFFLRFIRRVGEPLAVGRELLVALTPRIARDLSLLAEFWVGGDDEDFAAGVDRGVVTICRDRESVRPVLRLHRASQIGLRVKGQVDRHARRRGLAHLQRPHFKFVLVRDGRSVRTHRRKLHPVVCMTGHLLGGAAAGRDAENVEVTAAFRREVDLAVSAPHRVHVLREVFVVAQIGVGQARDLLRLRVLQPDVVCAVAAIAFAPVGGAHPVEGERRAVLFEHALDAAVDRHRRRQAAIDRHDVNRAAPGADGAAGGHHDALAVGRPVEDRVRRGGVRQLFRFTSRSGDDEHVVVAVTVRRKRHPSAVWRETRKDIPGDMGCESRGVGAVLVRDPDVAVVTEDEFALAHMGVAGELDGFGRGQPSHCQKGRERESQCGSHSP